MTRRKGPIYVSRLYSKNTMKPRTSRLSLPTTAVASIFVAFSTVTAVLAATSSWNGGSGSWDDSANWTPNILPSSADTAVFGGTSGTVTATAAQSVLGLQFSASDYTLAGADLTIGTGGIQAAAVTSGTISIGNPITAASGTQTWNIGTGGTLAVGTLPTQFGPAGGIVLIKGSATTTAGNGWDWRGAGGQGLLGPGFVIDNGNNTYDWARAGAAGVIAAPAYVAAGTGDKNNVKVTANTTVNGLNASWASLLVDGGTFTANGANLYIDTGIILQNGGTLSGTDPIKANNDGLYVYVPNTGTISSNILNNGATAKNLHKSGAGTLTLTGNDTYSGTTYVNSGTLNIGGAGNINSTSGIIVRGSDAKLTHTSSTASTRTVTLTRGTVDGTGTLATVNVENLAANTITNGNGTGSGTLTIGTLSFAGAGTISVNESGATHGLAVATLTTPNTGLGAITLNAANSSGWSSGSTYNLITYTTFNGTLADFTKGTIPGISGRQNATLGNSGTAITLAVTGDNPVWTGTGSQTWTTAATDDNTGPNAWALKTGHTATNFWINDAVEFNDTYNLGSGDVPVANSTVTISGGVAPVSTLFNNSAVDYIVNSNDATGITSGSVSKTGTGTVTLNTPNSYTGPTTINSGTLSIGGNGSLGAGTYAGSISNQGVFRYNSSADQSLTGVISGAGSLTHTGTGQLTLSGANTFSGSLTVENGVLSVSSVNNSGANGPLGNSNTAVMLGNTGSNGTLRYTGGAGSVTTSKTFTLATGGTGTFQIDNASAELKLTAANGLSGDGMLIKTGPGVLAMGDAGHNYSGGTVIQNGQLQGGNTIATASFGTGPITLGVQGGTDNVAIGLGNGGVIAANDILITSGTGTRSIFGGSGANETFSGTITLGDGGGAGHLNLATLYAGSASSKLILSNTVSGTGNIQMYANNIYNSNGSHDVTLAGPQDQSGTISSIDSPVTPAYATHGVNTISGSLGGGITNITQDSLNSTLVLSGFNLDFTGTVTVANGTLKLGAYSALNTSSQVTVATAGSFDINGTDGTIGGLIGSGFVTNNGVAATLTIGGNISNSFDGNIGGNMGLTIDLGDGATQTLNGFNYYNGDTNVNSGVLAVNGDAIPDSNKLVINGGTVNPMGNTETVDRLFFGSVQQDAGTYGASGSGAEHIDDIHFTGSGVVNVLSDPPAGYAAWAELYAPGQSIDEDHDDDGVANGIEYFMGETGSTFTANPAITGGTVTWPMDFFYAGLYGTDYEVQTSTDLNTWTQASEGSGPGSVSVNPGVSVTYTMPISGGSFFVRLAVRN